jgi:hypothetical protein
MIAFIIFLISLGFSRLRLERTLISMDPDQKVKVLNAFPSFKLHFVYPFIPIQVLICLLLAIAYYFPSLYLMITLCIILLLPAYSITLHFMLIKRLKLIGISKIFRHKLMLSINLQMLGFAAFFVLSFWDSIASIIA